MCSGLNLNRYFLLSNAVFLLRIGRFLPSNTVPPKPKTEDSNRKTENGSIQLSCWNQSLQRPWNLKSQSTVYLLWYDCTFGTNWTQQGPEIDLDSVINPHYKVHNNSATKVWWVLKLLHNWMHFTSHFLALILLTDPKHLLDQIIEVRLSLIWKHVQASVYI